MKLLLDANISWRLVAILKEHFNECYHVDNIELEVPAKDSEIWEYAQQNRCVIVTHDDDFGNLIAVKGFPPKVILLRMGNNKTMAIAELLIKSKVAIEDFCKNEEYGLLEII